MTKANKTSLCQKDQKEESLADITSECVYEEVPLTTENLHDLLEWGWNTHEATLESMIIAHIEGEDPYLGESDDPLFRTGEIIIKYYARKLRMKAALPAASCEFLADTLERILDGEDANAAFKLTKQRGGQASVKKVQRDILLYNLVSSYMEDGMSYDNAIEKVAIAFDPDNTNIADAVVEKAYKEIKKQFNSHCK